MSTYDIGSIGEILSSNTYPGRGIVIGKSKNGEFAVFAYFIMGRSDNSRNRVFINEDDEIIIHPFDASKVEDPSLIIYSPVKTYEDKIIVTNGDQTDTIYNCLKEGGSFEGTLESRCFEPDAPNFTPRISGILSFTNDGFTYKMSILKSADSEGNACNRFTYSYAPIDGLGHFIHTYNCDGNPIPTFTGEPERIEIPDDINEFTDMLWTNLNENNKISLAVRYIDLKTGDSEQNIINKNEKE